MTPSNVRMAGSLFFSTPLYTLEDETREVQGLNLGHLALLVLQPLASGSLGLQQMHLIIIRSEPRFVHWVKNVQLEIASWLRTGLRGTIQIRTLAFRRTVITNGYVLPFQKWNYLILSSLQSSSFEMHYQQLIDWLLINKKYSVKIIFKDSLS